MQREKYNFEIPAPYMMPDTSIKLCYVFGFEAGIRDVESIPRALAERTEIEYIGRPKAKSDICDKLRLSCCIKYPTEIAAEVILVG